MPGRADGAGLRGERLCWGGARQVAPSGASAIPDGIDALRSGRKGYPPCRAGEKTGADAPEQPRRVQKNVEKLNYIEEW